MENDGVMSAIFGALSTMVMWVAMLPVLVGKYPQENTTLGTWLAVTGMFLASWFVWWWLGKCWKECRSIRAWLLLFPAAGAFVFLFMCALMTIQQANL